MKSKGKLNPEIFVRRKDKGPYDREYARAHLRNKKGDVFLCWKDEGKVRNFYLGRRKQKPPTADKSTSELQAPAIGAAAAESSRGE